jgi:hypothetical protein
MRAAVLLALSFALAASSCRAHRPEPAPSCALVDCDDGVSCTEDSCAPDTGRCEHTPQHERCADSEICDPLLDCRRQPCATQADCDDGLRCNGEERCLDGICHRGSPVECDDGIACTRDRCVEPGGTCEHPADDAMCDDGLWCNGAEVCAAGEGCIASRGPCEATYCDEATRVCLRCSGDGDCPVCYACTADGRCQAEPAGGDVKGACASRACSTGGCDGRGACALRAVGADCGACRQCDEQGACTLEPAGTDARGECGDGVFCDGLESCNGGGACVAAAKPACGQLGCLELLGRCVECASDSDCPVCHVCGAPGLCVPESQGSDQREQCSAGPCTTGTCDGQGSCGVLPAGTACGDQSEAPCDRANSCDGKGLCQDNFVALGTRCPGTDEAPCSVCTGTGSCARLIRDVRTIPLARRAGLTRQSGDGQFGPAGHRLPSPLVVELDDPAGQPLAGEAVTFMVARAGSVCFGEEAVLPRLCNSVESSVLVGDGSRATDAHGQAAVELTLAAGATGITVVRASAGGESVDFYAVAVAELGPALDMAKASPRPALGPLDTTVRPATVSSRTYLGNLSHYSMVITGLSARVGGQESVTNGVPSAPLGTGALLTINGQGFAAAGNHVWVGGSEGPVVPGSESPTAITVQVPEGVPGAAAVTVLDGTSLALAGAEGSLAASVTAPANFWRTALRSVSLPATGDSPLRVQAAAHDYCGQELAELSGETVALAAYLPGTDTLSERVLLSAPDSVSGIALVQSIGTYGSSEIVAVVSGKSSRATPGASLVVTNGDALAAAGPFSAGDAAPAATRSLAFRGGSQSPSNSVARMNPTLVFDSLRLGSSTLQGEGRIENVPPVDGRVASIAGSLLYGVSGGSAGVLAVMAAETTYCITMYGIPMCGSKVVSTLVLTGSYLHVADRHELELGANELFVYDPELGEQRQVILRLQLSH